MAPVPTHVGGLPRGKRASHASRISSARVHLPRTGFAVVIVTANAANCISCTTADFLWVTDDRIVVFTRVFLIHLIHVPMIDAVNSDVVLVVTAAARFVVDDVHLATALIDFIRRVHVI